MDALVSTVVKTVNLRSIYFYIDKASLLLYWAPVKLITNRREANFSAGGAVGANCCVADSLDAAAI